MTLKATMTIEQYNELSPEPLMAALRAELGCHEPLCVLAITAAPGSVILTVVATDRAPSSQVHAAATVMGSIDAPTLSAKLKISISEAPVVQPVRYVQVVVVIPAPSPPPPSPPPPSPATAPTGSGTDSKAAALAGDGGDGGGPPIAAIGGGAAVAILLTVGLGCYYLGKKRMAGSQSPVAQTAISLSPTKEKDLESGAPATKGPTATYSVELTKTPMGLGLSLADDVVTEVKPDSQAARGGRIKVWASSRVAVRVRVSLT